MIQTLIYRTVSKMFPAYRDSVWRDGFEVGKSNAERDYMKQIELRLEKNSLKEFSSDELKLGYDYAVKLIKGDF